MRKELQTSIILLTRTADELSRLYCTTGNSDYLTAYERVCTLIVDLKSLVKSSEGSNTI